jgi:hypothetical protein
VAILRRTETDRQGRNGTERCERPMSKEHDDELRGIALGSLLQCAAAGQAELLGRAAEQILSAPRLQAPFKRPRRYAVSVKELAFG